MNELDTLNYKVLTCNTTPAASIFITDSKKIKVNLFTPTQLTAFTNSTHRTMKKTGLFFTALFLLGIGNVYAQTTSTDVAVSATIEGSLTIANQNDLAFGTVSAGAAATVDETASADAGKLFIEGTAGQQVIVNAPTTLTLTGPGDDISTTLSYVGNDADDQGAAAEGNLGGGGGNVTLNATTGEYYIWVGGNFTTPVTQVNGAYNANLTIEIEYL